MLCRHTSTLRGYEEYFEVSRTVVGILIGIRRDAPGVNASAILSFLTSLSLAHSQFYHITLSHTASDALRTSAFFLQTCVTTVSVVLFFYH